MSRKTPIEIPIRFLYCDGGVSGRNPSDHGGSWAYVHVSEFGTAIREASGFVKPICEPVSNNYTELLAAVMALESVPDGWTGTLYTDSGVTIKRLKGGGTCVGQVNTALFERMRAAQKRLGYIRYVLLSGHPTRKELKEGFSKEGRPVSKHNVTCDKLCSAEIKRARASGE